MITTLVVVSTATLVVVAGMNVVSARKTLRTIEGHLRASIEHKGAGLVTNQALALRDLVADNAFGDVARLVERTLEKDEQLVYGLFLDEDQKAWGFSTRQRISRETDDWKRLGVDPSKLKARPRGNVGGEFRQVLGQSVFEFSMLVVDDKGTALGGLYYGLSDRPLRQALAEARSDSRRALLVTVALLVLLGAVTIVMGGIRSRQSAVRITQPVTDLTRAVNTLASGNRDIRVEIMSGDELEILGGAFNNMATELKESYESLENMNRTLEAKVQERTHELAERNRDMRLVLDNVNQGFLTVSISGKLAHEHSAIVDQWFGSCQGDIQFEEYIAKSDPNFAIRFKMGYEALVEDILPRELCLKQMPTRLQCGGNEYRCAYFAILKREQLDGLLIVINDETAELVYARQEAERKEILSMFEALTSDRTGFLSFMDEADDILSKDLNSGDVVLQRRGLHTLKGNAGLVGFGIIARLCHEAEDELADRFEPLSREALAPLENRWHVLNKALRNFLGDKGRDVLELSTKQIEELQQEIRAGESTSRLLDRVASWGLESAELPLRRLARHALALAARLGKGDLQIEIAANGVRLAPKPWAGLWTDLVHVVRNAVDHGLETPKERATAQKEARPKLRLSVGVVDHKFVVEIEDSGRGVDWAAVKMAAEAKALPSATQEDLIHAMFTSGVSTAKSVTTISGRGIGLSSVRQQVADLGGRISVVSKPGQGTCFRFAFDLSDVGPRFGVDVIREGGVAEGPAIGLLGEQRGGSDARL
jgi:two-component system chemotaxis sensor kinase CheA